MHLDDKQQDVLKRRFQEAVREAHSDDEAYRAILRLFQEWLTFPLNGTVLGIPVAVSGIQYEGNTRTALIAETVRRNRLCRLPLLSISFPALDGASALLAAYQEWAGWRSAALPGSLGHRQPDPEPRVTDMAVYAVRPRTAVCRLIGSDEEAIVHLSSWDLLNVIPGEIISLAVRKSWNYGRRHHISGELLSHRFDLPRLGLTPLRLHEKDNWDPGELFEGWPVGEGEERIPDFYVPIVAAGARAAFEMEQVIPGHFDPDGDDPILQSVQQSQMGDRASARALLMKLLEEDLRCLDAFAHLGNMEVDGNTEKALRYYQAGLEIGDLSLPDKFNGLLSWGNIDNRPYLRCLHGYGLALWRLERFGEAEEVFERLLWLDPSDSLGIRFLIPEVREKKSWKPDP